MNCNNLTPSEAIDLYYIRLFHRTDSSLPIEFKKRRLEIQTGTFFVNDYRNGNENDAYIKGQFRGFLKGKDGGWVIYIGDETQIYWSINNNLMDKRNYSYWSEWNGKIDIENQWSAGSLFDITDIICKSWNGPLINWRTDPFEVKS